MRARYPDIEDVVVRDGVRIGYEVYGSGTPTILLPSSMPLVHARQWKAQVPFLARYFRVVVVDGRGNGRSDRPVGPGAYALAEQVADLVTVLDATGTDQAVVVGLSAGARCSLVRPHPTRLILAATACPRRPSTPISPASSTSSSRRCSPTRTRPSCSTTLSSGPMGPARTYWSTSSPRSPTAPANEPG